MWLLFRKHIVLVWLALLCCGSALAQQPINTQLEDLLELLEEEEVGTTDGEDLMERYDGYRDNPFNLNDTAGLDGFPFLNDFQIDALRSYIQQYGFLRSLNELQLINGFDAYTIALISPIVATTEPTMDNHFTFGDMLRYGKNDLVAGYGSVLERARGYREAIYDGSPLHLYGRYRFRYSDRVQLQLSWDKDPGESLFSSSQPRGFDFYGFHIMLNDFGKFKRTIIGQYQLQFGQGLTLWTGFAPFGATTTNISRVAQGIRPASAYVEYGFLQGAATTLSINKHWYATAFYSNVMRDATATQSYFLSGYHRTASELEKRNQIREQLIGGNVQYQSQNLQIGVTAYFMHLDKALMPDTNRYNQYTFRGDENYNLGVHGKFLLGKALFFGEVAMSQNNAFAGIGGMQYNLNNDNRFCAYYRNYATDYQNLYAAAVGQQRRNQNEHGLCLNFQTLLPLGFHALLRADFYRFPWLRYQVYAPSYGTEYRLNLSRNLQSGIDIELRYRYKSGFDNTTLPDHAEYLVQQTTRQQVQANLQYTTGGWELTTRIAYTHFQSEFEQAKEGFLLYQDVSFHAGKLPLTLTARFALFDIDDYDARLYAVESDMAYSFSSTTYLDQGLRSYLVVRYNITPSLSLAAKYAITAYSDKETVGTGYEAIDANHKQVWKIQLHWKF